jgi:hypothetical protein
MIKEIWICKNKVKYEHAWAFMFQNIEGVTVPVPHFGSSDCKCPSHLFAFNSRPSLNQFQNLAHREFSGDLKILSENRLSDLHISQKPLIWWNIVEWGTGTNK